MLALRNSKVDLSKWELVSYGRSPPSKVETLAAQGFVIIEIAQTIVRAARRFRPSRSFAVDVFHPTVAVTPLAPEDGGSRVRPDKRD